VTMRQHGEDALILRFAGGKAGHKVRGSLRRGLRPAVRQATESPVRVIFQSVRVCTHCPVEADRSVPTVRRGC